ncbi:MAG: sulfotransferase [Actinobacteria bacterium]|nr:sulfotransferase [Actinomycetota bacterium]
MRVVYIASKGRSGSTLLSHCLGQFDGFFSAGELWHLWDWGLLEGRRCGCGRAVPDCDVWSRVVADEALAGQDARQVVAWQRAVLDWRAAPRVLAARPGRSPAWPPLSALARVRGALYRAIGRVTGARVVVDSSKWPWDPVLMGLVPGVQAAGIHLVRDPRGVAHSWRRRKSWQDHDERPDDMPRFDAAYTAASWLGRNAVVEVVRRRGVVPWMRLRYEDFVHAPHATLRAVADLVGESAGPPAVTDGRTLVCAPTHTVAGNAARFQRGRVTLRADDEWERSLAERDAVVAGLVGAPLLRRYGYPLRAGSTR